MKKAKSLIVILVMVMALSACSKSEPESDKKDAEPTKEPAVTQALPDKEQEPTADPEPTSETEPTSDVFEPSEEDDEFASAGHAYQGIWQCGDVVLQIDPEGAGDILSVFAEPTDKETYGTWRQFLSNFNLEGNRFISNINYSFSFDSDGNHRLEEEESEQIFEVEGDTIRWGEMVFEKISEDTSDNPYFNNPYVGNEEFEEDDFAEGFTLESVDTVDVVSTVFYGVYCQHKFSVDDSYYYTYLNDVRSMENMDEFAAAFLDLGTDGEQGQLCFLEEGINDDISWSIEDGALRITDNYSNALYQGEFYWDQEGQELYVRLDIGDFFVWLAAER
ncbi:MAG: hypothetical protein ILP10_07310 [Lachnospiraceae bacterium]|nr:hypothetical protein [Lachnospiraceae bacterium]